MRKLILALAAVALTSCGCCLFRDDCSRSYYRPVSDGPRVASDAK